jgi:very-short-patch-repair endonuclease
VEREFLRRFCTFRSHVTEGAPRRRPAAYLARFGIEVIRFTNADVAEDIEVVLEAIAEAVKRQNYPQTPPS